MKNNLLELHTSLRTHPFWKFVYRPFVVLFGFLAIIAGIIMCFTPGQGLLTILLGIAVLSGEFAWAKKLMRIGIYYKNKIVRKMKGKHEPLRSSNNTASHHQREEVLV